MADGSKQWEMPRAHTTEEQDLEARLARVVNEQCEFLMRVAPGDVQRTDATKAVESLRRVDGTVIHPPPVAAQKALAAARDPATSVDMITELFEQDPTMTRGLLQTANSAFYRRSLNPCLSIPEAIQRVGVRGVESIIVTSMVEGLLCRPGSAYESMLTAVWKHMTRTAPIARTLAPAFDVPRETAFTLGLLHDMGKLIVFDHLSLIRKREKRDLEIPERFLLNMLNWLHEPLGGIASIRWNLGVHFAVGIAGHHRQPPPGDADAYTELICVAELLDHAARTRVPADLPSIWDQMRIHADLKAVQELVDEDPSVGATADDAGTDAAAA